MLLCAKQVCGIDTVPIHLGEFRDLRTEVCDVKFKALRWILNGLSASDTRYGALQVSDPQLSLF
jgi:hypothetical protein